MGAQTRAKKAAAHNSDRSKASARAAPGQTKRPRTAKAAAAKPRMADQADRHALYQASVQVPEADIAIFEQVFAKLRRRKPLSMREDFCGTAFLSCEWVRSHPRRTAIGIDLDEPTLAWGRAHNVDTLTPAQQRRLRLICGDVRDAEGERTELTCALNFSYGVFKTREALREYFAAVYDRLTDDGVFVTELYGGTEAIVELEESREVEGFDYEWEQASYNPITHETLCHIHFAFPDGSRLQRAFTYDWRLWTIPELREVLREVGFTTIEVWWEGVDEDGEGSGEFAPTECQENQESWLVYIVAGK